MSPRIAIVNPLGGALRHYTEALGRMLGTTLRFAVDEPSVSGSSRQRWLLRYAGALRRASRSVGRGGTIVVTWPTVGYLDLLVIALAVPRRVHVALVVHDPEPLVHAVGLGSSARRAMRRVAPHARLVVHGTEALTAVTRHGFGPRTVVLPHPVLPGASGLEARRTPAIDRPVLRVIGQYKPDRDVRLLAGLAPGLQSDYRLEIHGRGWPRVPGWDVTDRFLPEAELDDLIATSAVVLIPYRRFFQSGIAIRALELGVPFVGPRVPALEALVGADDAVLPRTDADWPEAIAAATVLTSTSLRARAESIADCSGAAWRRALGVRA